MLTRRTLILAKNEAARWAAGLIRHQRPALNSLLVSNCDGYAASGNAGT